MLLKKLMLSVLLIITFGSIAHNSLSIQDLSLKNASAYKDNYITGGQPSISDLELLAKQGIKHVINLRSEGEFNNFNEKEIVESLGMVYLNLEIGGVGDLNQNKIKAFSKLLSNKKTLVHCASGNRVGALFALDAYFVKNTTADEAIYIGKKTGLTRLESKVNSMIINAKNP
jgi:protein tyrosine phosphatase (PTP) superfamily phosphohydrolase (DUF442 family)